MVGRFESGELRREALAHEGLTSRQGLAGKCWCLVCAFIVAVGLYSVFGGSALFGGSPSTATSLGIPAREVSTRTSPAPSPPISATSPSPAATPSPGPLEFGLDDEPDFYRREKEDIKHLGTDFSLMGILLTVIALCAAPPLFRALNAPWSSVGGYSTGWPGGPGRGNDLLYQQQAVPGTLLGSNYGMGARDGRIIDVKPGELRGGAAGGAFGGGWMDQGAGMDWARGGTPGAGGFGLPQLGVQGGAVGGGSWCSPVPSPYSNVGPIGLPGAPGAAGSWPGALGGGWGGASNFGVGQGHGMPGANLPSEAEVTEAYASFGSELQQWVPRLSNIIQKEIIEPLIQELEESDKLWQQALASRGWRLTDQAPRQTYPGMGPQVQELSVFDRYLPQQLLQFDPRAGDLWSRRQQLESYLVHPLFGPEQRPYVLGRLREWRDRGLQNIMRAEFRQHDQLPTDAHILENLVVKMLNISMEFDKCFLATPHAPPLAKHLGQSPVAYLRQVTDQSVTPKPAPHYEVLTLTKVWKLRPGNRNLFEAVALLIHMLRRHHSRSFQSFPTALRNAVEPTTLGAIASLPGRIFPSLFGGLG